MRTILLLTVSNFFMNLAWCGHLKFKSQPLWLVILASLLAVRGDTEMEARHLPPADCGGSLFRVFVFKERTRGFQSALVWRK